MTTITVSTSPQRGTRVRGIARITIDGITVAPFRIMDSQKGLFVAMPQNQRRDGSWIDLFHALSAESRHLLQDWILTTFCTDEPATKEFSFPSEFTLATSVTPITAGNTTCIGFANLDICATFRIENIVAINFHNPYSSADNCNPSIQDKEHIGTKIKKESKGSFSLS